MAKSEARDTRALADTQGERGQKNASAVSAGQSRRRTRRTGTQGSALGDLLFSSSLVAWRRATETELTRLGSVNESSHCSSLLASVLGAGRERRGSALKRAQQI